MAPKRRPPEERFWAMVDRSGDCWLWNGAKSPRGYGAFGVEAGRVVRAHRFAYELTNGRIPAGMEIDHKVTCPKSCVNPAHLRPTTHKQNQENRGAAQVNNKSSGIRGVTWSKQLQRWRGQVQHNGRNHYVGTFDTASAAAVAVQARRNELFTHNDADRETRSAIA